MRNPAAKTLKSPRNNIGFRAEVCGDSVCVENRFKRSDGAYTWGPQGKFRMSIQTFGMPLAAFNDNKSIIDIAIP